MCKIVLQAAPALALYAKDRLNLNYDAGFAVPIIPPRKVKIDMLYIASLRNKGIQSK